MTGVEGLRGPPRGGPARRYWAAMSRRSFSSRAVIASGAAALAFAATGCGGADLAAIPTPKTVHVEPAGGAPSEPVAAGPVPTTTTLPPTTTSLPGSVHYEVAAGDTLYGIASRFGTTVDVLLKLNPLTDANRLLAGQDLIVPNPALTATTAPVSASATSTTGVPTDDTGVDDDLPIFEESPVELEPETTASTLPAATKDG